MAAGGAQDFDNNGNIIVPGSPSLNSDIRTKLTLSMWLISDDALTGQDARSLEQSNQNFFIGGFPGEQNIIIKPDNDSSGEAGNLSAITWYLLHDVFDGGNTTLQQYIDGTLKAENTSAPRARSLMTREAGKRL